LCCRCWRGTNVWKECNHCRSEVLISRKVASGIYNILYRVNCAADAALRQQRSMRPKQAQVLLLQSSKGDLARTVIIHRSLTTCAVVPNLQGDSGEGQLQSTKVYPSELSRDHASGILTTRWCFDVFHRGRFWIQRSRSIVRSGDFGCSQSMESVAGRPVR
jgi:hypothetical protein